MASAIPQGAYLKGLSAQFNQHTLLRHLRSMAPLEPELWARVVVDEGEVELFLEGQRVPIRCTPATPGIIPAGTPFRLEPPAKPARFQLHYYHEPRLRDEGELASLLTAGARSRQPA